MMSNKDVICNALSEYPLVEICGNPDDHHIVFARKSGSYQPTLSRLINTGKWQSVCAESHDQLAKYLEKTCIPPFPAVSYPARVVFVESDHALLYCSPVPEDLSLDVWYAGILWHSRSISSFSPNFGVVSVVATGLSAFRHPEAHLKGAKKNGMDPQRYISVQVAAAVSLLERDQPLDPYPY